MELVENILKGVLLGAITLSLSSVIVATAILACRAILGI